MPVPSLAEDQWVGEHSTPMMDSAGRPVMVAFNDLMDIRGRGLAADVPRFDYGLAPDGGEPEGPEPYSGYEDARLAEPAPHPEEFSGFEDARLLEPAPKRSGLSSSRGPQPPQAPRTVELSAASWLPESDPLVELTRVSVPAVNLSARDLGIGAPYFSLLDGEGKPRPWNMDKALAHLNANALESWNDATGYCARYTANAIDAGWGDGYKMERTNYAKDFGPGLVKAGFRPIEVNGDYVAQRGDVMLLDSYSGQEVPAGHMQMFNGSIWVSEVKQYGSNGVWAGMGFLNNNVKRWVYRW